jgi:hypothetical protein
MTRRCKENKETRVATENMQVEDVDRLKGERTGEKKVISGCLED